MPRNLPAPKIPLHINQPTPRFIHLHPTKKHPLTLNLPPLPELPSAASFRRTHQKLSIQSNDPNPDFKPYFILLAARYGNLGNIIPPSNPNLLLREISRTQP
ncbi:hypothetical protein DSO57_1010194 [Entomophthora muscae]|uniref:Uncharacterized protein n=1 Tax=Entomophthora muscae TaxID=34485 RepID=A0ACC2USE9_9FUNG|nr:hypothetical protein DSO57_1010194 [Entomophthora muscae]